MKKSNKIALAIAAGTAVVAAGSLIATHKNNNKIKALKYPKRKRTKDRRNRH